MRSTQASAARRLRALAKGQHDQVDGHVRGPGSSTSDSIPARLSDGEFVLPADTVKAVGVKSLRDLVARTHEPTGGPALPGHFADGGLVDEDRLRKPNSFGDAAAAAQDSAVAQVSRSGSAMASPSNTFPGNRLQGDSGAGGMTTSQAARLAAAAAPASSSAPAMDRASAVNQIPTDGQRAAPAPDGSQDSWANTDAGRNISNIAAALPGVTGVVPVVARTGGAISGGINAVNRLLTAGAGTTASSLAMGTEPVAGATATPAAVARPVDPGAGMAAAPAAPSVSSGAASPPSPAAGSATSIRRVDRPGQAPLYTNLQDASPDLQGFTARPEGGPSAQNLAAADSLAAQANAESMARLRASGQIAAPAPPRSMSLSGGTFGFRRAASIVGAEIAGQQAFDYATGNDPASRKRAAALAQTSLEQQGSYQRAALSAQGTAEANQIARGRLSLEQIAAGYQNRSAGRVEAAQQAVENATTPEQQRSARQRLLTLLGKDGDDRWKAVALQGGTDAQGNKTDSILGAVNERTGEMRRMGAQAQATQAPPEGTRVRGQDGRIYEVRGGQPVPVGN